MSVHILICSGQRYRKEIIHNEVQMTRFISLNYKIFWLLTFKFRIIWAELSFSTNNKQTKKQEKALEMVP